MTDPVGTKKRTATRKGDEARPVGRPSAYQAEYAEQAKKLCLLGATDAQLADFFGVSRVTIDAWKNTHQEFLDALKDGKDAADAAVAHSLFHRATGYSHKAVKIVADAKTGMEHIVPFTEHYPPDTTACIFWLKNRQPKAWRDKQEIEHGGTLTLSALVESSYKLKD
ncbi:MAG TPA: helix-turn-helix domain-containing protein [Aliidongia sp.]|uniref:helix-turn-helix domain-containing protein n=1 Tax=Aliidongia sp. TaxID=1914230 RepID=UPI002DDD263E|nr:helix-turn-helix domain-containing protein [Aliidongia sp.]HEV2674134.1 helix-turn-helix domain-containing protein [Aliidongia sp.]